MIDKSVNKLKIAKEEKEAKRKDMAKRVIILPKAAAAKVGVDAFKKEGGKSKNTCC